MGECAWDGEQVVDLDYDECLRPQIAFSLPALEIFN